MNNNINNQMKINKHKLNITEVEAFIKLINKMNILNTLLFNIVELIKVINIFKLNILIYKINNQINN